MLKNYRELRVWQESYRLCLDIYRITKSFPKEEKYGLTNQVRRAAVSIPSHIAEGYGRKTIGEYTHSLYIAYGSECELDTQIQLCHDLGYIKSNELKGIEDKIKGVERMLKALIKSLEHKNQNP